MGVPGTSRFTVRTDVRNDVTRIAVIGELDLCYAPDLQEHLRQVVDGGARAALLDLRDVTFMDAAGLRTLLWARDHADENGHRIAVVGVGGEPRKVLEITGTGGRLIDEAEGMELIRRFTRPDGSADDQLPTEAGGASDG